MRIQYAHCQPEIASDFSHWLQKVRIVRNEDSQVIQTLESVVKKMSCQVYV
jgi:predicted class III extradiol MEMO1 family dioxygenase